MAAQTVPRHNHRVKRAAITEDDHRVIRAAAITDHDLEKKAAQQVIHERGVDLPQLKDYEHVPNYSLEFVEKRMNSVVFPKYSGPEAESPPTIYTVPYELKRGKEYAYLPAAVQVGPLVNRWIRGASEEYSPLQDYKWCCVRWLISRHHALERPKLLSLCLGSLKILEPRIRACYQREVEPVYPFSDEDRLGMDREDQLVLAMLLDGCFILHRLLKYARIARREDAAAASPSSSVKQNLLPRTILTCREPAAAASLIARREKDDAPSSTSAGAEDEYGDDLTLVFGNCWVWQLVTYDLLLLQNQIPFFVVQKLLELLRTPNETNNDDVLVAGALRLFRSLQPHSLHPRPTTIACGDVHHILHLFYLSVLPHPAKEKMPRHGDAGQRDVPPSELEQWVPCAKELEEAGVKFRARKGGFKDGATSFLDVKFNRGVLEIPALELYDYSETLLRNLIAFEQTYPWTASHVTAYAIFMDCLVASPEDLRLLQLSGVLVNHMNGGDRDRDAAGLFGRLSHGAHLASNDNYLTKVIMGVNNYQRARRHQWCAALVRNNFSNPWVATSLAAAVFLLALTILQSFFAAYSYFKPPKQ